MRLRRLTLHTVRLPLVSPFTTSFGTGIEKETYLFEAVPDLTAEPVAHHVRPVVLGDARAPVAARRLPAHP